MGIAAYSRGSRGIARDADALMPLALSRADKQAHKDETERLRAPQTLGRALHEDGATGLGHRRPPRLCRLRRQGRLGPLHFSPLARGRLLLLSACHLGY